MQPVLNALNIFICPHEFMVDRISFNQLRTHQLMIQGEVLFVGVYFFHQLRNFVNKLYKIMHLFFIDF